MTQERNTKTLIKKVRKIEIKTRGLTDQIFSGDYHSAFKGQGMSFSEVRNYQFGDDVRSIDWNVTARTGEPHIKVFEEERELTVILMVDISPSVFTGMQRSHHELMAELCAVIAFSAAQNNDKVGLLLFSDEVELFIPPAKGKKHILRIIREVLVRESSSGRTRIGNALKHLSNIIHKRSIVFLMSDFFSEPFQKPLNVVSRRHDLIAMHIRSEFEKGHFPKGIYQFQNAEDGTKMELDASDERQMEQWIQHFEHHTQKIKDQFRKQGAEMIDLFADEAYITRLHQFFSSRKK